MAPQPKALQVLKGETRPSRIPEWEPEAEPGPVVPPYYLTDGGRDVWRSYAAELESVGLLRPRNADHFAMWCESVAQWRRLAVAMDDAPPTILAERGERGNPLLREFQRFAELARRLGADFGMTPSAVTAIGRALSASRPDSSPTRLFT